MYIPNRSYLESGMQITYEDIQRQRVKLDQQYEDRRTKLQQDAYKLAEEYKESLSLPKETWVDSSGTDRPYVMLGTINDKGLFQRASLSSIRLDESYALNFKIATIVDDSRLSGGSQYLISISMQYNDGRLCVVVGKDSTVIIVSSPDQASAFHEVCAAIKQLIMIGFTDSRLD